MGSSSNSRYKRFIFAHPHVGLNPGGRVWGMTRSGFTFDFHPVSGLSMRRLARVANSMVSRGLRISLEPNGWYLSEVHSVCTP